MDNLQTKFVGCKFSTEEIRDVIRTVLKLENGYFCFCCFKFLSVDTLPKNCGLCKVCYQYYCGECTKLFVSPERDDIDPYRCLQCVESRRYRV